MNPLRVCIILLFTCTSLQAVALPLYSTGNCPDAEASYQLISSAQKTSQEIHVYIDENFGANMWSCSDEHAETTQFKVEQELKEALEIWNSQARGAHLVFRGTYDAGNHPAGAGIEVDICGDLPQEPAVFVVFKKGCDVDDGECDEGVIANARKIVGCESIRLQVHGDRNNKDACVMSGKIDWRLDEHFSAGQIGDDDPRSLMGMFIHEFGHVLGLGHYNSDSNNNLMHQNYAGVEDWWHLDPWTKDCVDEKWGGREARPRSKSYSSTGVQKELEYIDDSYRTQKGSLHGYPWRANSNFYYVYGFMDPAQDYRYAQLGSDGYLSWINSGSNWSSVPVDSNPLYSNWSPGSANGQQVFYNYAPTTSTNPPQLKTVYSANFFSSSSVSRLKEGSTNLDSHIPLRTAIDPSSNLNIAIYVQTEEVTSGIPVDTGRMKIFPGFQNYNQLKSGTWLDPANFTLPSSGYHQSYSTWHYRMRTNFAPGIACVKPSDLGSGMNGYNCVLAWIDRGTPDNRLLYVWFKVSGTGVFNFDTNVRVRSGAYGVNHVSAAYANGRMLLAFMSSNDNGLRGNAIATTENLLTSRTSWSAVSKVFPQPTGVPFTFLVDPPTWGTGGNTPEYTLLYSENL